MELASLETIEENMCAQRVALENGDYEILCLK